MFYLDVYYYWYNDQYRADLYFQYRAECGQFTGHKKFCQSQKSLSNDVWVLQQRTSRYVLDTTPTTRGTKPPDLLWCCPATPHLWFALLPSHFIFSSLPGSFSYASKILFLHSFMQPWYNTYIFQTCDPRKVNTSKLNSQSIELITLLVAI